jgi:hypothetical protein
MYISYLSSDIPRLKHRSRQTLPEAGDSSLKVISHHSSNLDVLEVLFPARLLLVRGKRSRDTHAWEPVTAGAIWIVVGHAFVCRRIDVLIIEKNRRH